MSDRHKKEEAAERTVMEKVRELLSEKERLIIAVDGRCAAGKTTFAERLKEKYGFEVIHMDHFFLRPDQRTKERLAEPGGNVDYERFLAEVKPSLQKGEAFAYRPYDCKSGKLGEPVLVKQAPVTVVEGAYACHPALKDIYDLKIFLDVEEKEQLDRIRKRNGDEQAAVFREKWIPLEERYFRAYQVEANCHIRLP